MGLERSVEQGMRDFDRVKQAIEDFYAQHRQVIERYEIVATPGVASMHGYYIALSSRMGAISWDHLGIPQSYEGIPVAVRRRT